MGYINLINLSIKVYRKKKQHWIEQATAKQFEMPGFGYIGDGT